nr:hypothetical protein [Tanacetum cinerariifolium]
MEQGDSCAFEDVFVSIPRGGPLYVSDMVGPLTTVSQFRSSVENQLKDLRNELYLDLTQQHLDEISVDELKILSDDELFDMAFQASLKGGNITRDNSQSAEECFNGTMNDGRVQDADHACSVKSGIDEDYVPTNLRRSARIRENGKMKKQEMKKQAPTKNKKVTKKDKTHEV